MLLTDFSDGVAVFGLETVLLGQRCFLDVLGYRPLHKHLLQILTVYPCEPGTNVDAWYLTSANHQIQRITFNTIDGYCFPNGDIVSQLGNTFGNQSQFLFFGFCSLLLRIGCFAAFLAAINTVKRLYDERFPTEFALPFDF